MGLDQSVYIKNEPEDIELFYWRKHPNLHGFIENLWRNKTNSKEDFNCIDFDLSINDIDDLELAIIGNTLPETQGFFFGTSSPERKEEDLKFIQLAKDAINSGKQIYYTSWW